MNAVVNGVASLSVMGVDDLLMTVRWCHVYTLNGLHT